jgi:hypothetical protein
VLLETFGGTHWEHVGNIISTHWEHGANTQIQKNGTSPPPKKTSPKGRNNQPRGCVHVESSHWPGHMKIIFLKFICHHFQPGLILLPKSVVPIWVPNTL